MGGFTVSRAGVYREQIGGYRAFVPAPLPPIPPIEMRTELLNALTKAGRLLGRLDGSIHTIPNSDLFVLMYVRKEAVLSSQIEGTQSSLQDVLEAEAKIRNAHRPGDSGEVINYISAMKHGLEMLEHVPVSVRLIRDIHKHLLDGTRGSDLSPGELRTVQNWIGSSGSRTIEDATFVPPPPGEVPDHLAALEQFIHSELDISLLIKIGMIHAQFETIHPFLDGNGRIGRLLVTFLLCEKKTLAKPVLYLSYYFKKHRMEYYDRLQAVRDSGAWEEWLIFFLHGIAEVSQQATETARAIIDLRETDRNMITNRFGRTAANGYRLLERLYTMPYVSVNEVMKWNSTSYKTASNLVARMVEAGIVCEVTGQKRGQIFCYQKYIDIFGRDESRGQK